MDRREFIGFPPPSPGMNYSSTSSINDSVTSDEIVSNRLKILMSMVKKQKKLFIGEYTARRLVQSIVPEYRDIVVVNKEEESLISCLKEIQKVISTEFGNEKWLGITSNLVEGKVEGYNLWVELNQVPFGKHWFQIRSLKIKDNTVQLQLKYIRPFQALKREYLNDENHPTFDLNKILTYKNICEAIKFTAVVLMSIFAVCGQLLWYLSDYSLKITRELSNLIRALTPVIFGFYELLAKCIGGIYWLIYMMFLGSNSRGGGPIVPPPPPMAIMPNNNNNNRQSYGYRQNYNKKWK